MEIPADQFFSFDDDAAGSFGLIDDRDVVDAEEDDRRREPRVGELLDSALQDLEGIAVQGRMLIADQYRVIGEVLREAETTPDPWVGMDPTLNPDWVDPRDRSVAAVRRERREFAVRAAAADIAVRLRMSETTVRTHAGHVETLRARCPRLWADFLGGAVQEQNAITAAQLAASLPEDGSEGCWDAFDQQVAEVAGRLTPGKFRMRARSIRERVHPESMDERHERAATDRDVWRTRELDGMATLCALLPAAAAEASLRSVDAHARHLRAQDGESRTLAQLRADAMADLLTAGSTVNGGAGGAVIAVTVPVMALLGQTDEPAILDAYGPIDRTTAKRLVGSATSMIRILTHPVTGGVLDVNRRTYRVPKALKRWLGVTYPVCVFPGCSRPARDCDIDHVIDWQFGGGTTGDNLVPECESHHRLKHGSRWTVHKDDGSGEVVWTSPTGNSYGGDPPPF